MDGAKALKLITTSPERITIVLLGGFFAVGLSIVVAAWLSIAHIEDNLIITGNLHEPALESLRLIDTLSNDAAQELFAYVIGGEEVELAEFHGAVTRIATESAHFASIAHLSGPNEAEELRMFGEIQANWSTYVLQGELLAGEYGRDAAVTYEQYEATESALDDYFESLDELLAVEFVEVTQSRAARDAIAKESEYLLATVAAVGLTMLVLIGAIVTRWVNAYVVRLREGDKNLELSAAALGATNVGICYTDAENDNAIVYANDSLSRITGYPVDELLGRNCRILQGEDTDKETVSAIHDAITHGIGINREILNYRKNGEQFWNELFVAPVRDETGSVTHFVGAMHDVTDRRALHEQFLRAQKMESIGRLAGGVAHDFNNYLMVINGTAEMLIASEEDTVSAQAQLILEAGNRSADLTKQLLALSSRQVMVPVVLDMNHVIMELDPLLRRTIGENINLETSAAGGLGMVSADRAQLDQVLLNLVVNARDAMPEGGDITIETGNVFLDREYTSRLQGIKEGRYVMIAVSDNGTGIPKGIRDQIFDPFFTTKEGGSGLGLSTVVGIVEQSGGLVQVYSEKDAGTTFKIYLPRVGGPAVSLRASDVDHVPDLRGVLLLVEDEDMVRQITCKMARGLGLSILQASSGEEALEVLEEQGDNIDALLTDVMLPGIGGRELANKATELYPNLGVVFMSGYTENGILHHQRLDEGILLLTKPFTIQELKRTLAEVLANK